MDGIGKLVRLRSAVFIVIACSVISGALGAAAAGEYVMRNVDAIDAARAAEQKKADTAKTDLIARYQQTAVDLNRELYSCQVKFQESTVLYEPAPGLNLSLSLRGIGVAPAAGLAQNETPRWVIPARIKPQAVAGTQGAVYYYIGADQRLDGPYVPEVHP